MGLPAEKINMDETPTVPVQTVSAVSTSVLDEKFHTKTVRESVKETGTVFALLFSIIAASHAYKGGSVTETLGWMFGAFASHFIAAYIPLLYYPIWKLWMGLGKVLELVASNVMIGLSWAIMMVPAGILLKVFGVKTIDRSYRVNVQTYWIDKKPQDYMLFKRQF